ncbi:MAG: thermonuclease family protein [Nannocystales bacterium]
MRRLISTGVLGLLLGLTASCGRTTVHYSRQALADSLGTPDAQAEAGLSLGEFALAPGAVVDGDTLKVVGLDASLRLLGLDTEETFKSEKDRRLYESLGFEAYMAKKGEGSDRPAKCATPLGDDAKKFAQAFFVGDISVKLERDHAKDMRGRFGRLLTYVFVKRGDEWINYNVEAVRAGMSPYFTKYGYSRRFHDEFVQAQKEAREAERGIWDPSLEHYRDYDRRLEWWDARGDFIARFEEDAQGREDMIMLGHWDALERIAAMEGKEIEVLAGVGEIYPGEGARPTRVMLSRRMFSDFPLIFFDEDVVLSSRIEEAKGEFARVRGTVSAYTYKSRRRRDDEDRTQLQIEVKLSQQVIISDTAPGSPSRTLLEPAPQPEDAPDPYEAAATAPPAAPPAPDVSDTPPEEPASDSPIEDPPPAPEAGPTGDRQP